MIGILTVAIQHRRHRYYRSLLERRESLEPEFDDEVRPLVPSAVYPPPGCRHRYRVTIPSIQPIRRRNRSESEAVSMNWVNSLAADLRPCCAHCPGNGARWRAAWRSVWSTLRQLRRYAAPLTHASQRLRPPNETFERSQTSSSRPWWWTARPSRARSRGCT